MSKVHFSEIPIFISLNVTISSHMTSFVGNIQENVAFSPAKSSNQTPCEIMKVNFL